MRNFYDWLACMLSNLSLACTAFGVNSFMIWHSSERWRPFDAHPLWYMVAGSVGLMVLALPAWVWAERVEWKRKANRKDAT